MMDIYKMAVMEHVGVSKTSVIIQFVIGSYVDGYLPTFKDAYRKQFVVDNNVCLLDILDTVGEKEYAVMQDQLIRECEGSLVVYSVTSASSFAGEFLIIIVGAKSDIHNKRVVSKIEGHNFSKGLGYGFLEVSAKTSVNVSEAFSGLVREIQR
ncbi:small GTPase superfamily [Tricladium varicosporioides]|nr:small GTPase superfamily [Hymenoscyphus varicosporioides]